MSARPLPIWWVAQPSPGWEVGHRGASGRLPVSGAEHQAWRGEQKAQPGWGFGTGRSPDKTGKRVRDQRTHLREEEQSVRWQEEVPINTRPGLQWLGPQTWDPRCLGSDPGVAIHKLCNFGQGT